MQHCKVAGLDDEPEDFPLVFGQQRLHILQEDEAALVIWPLSYARGILILGPGPPISFHTLNMWGSRPDLGSERPRPWPAPEIPWQHI